MFFGQIKLPGEPVVVAEVKASLPLEVELAAGFAIGSVVIGNKPYDVYKGARDGFYRYNQHGHKVYMTLGQVDRISWF